MLLALAAALIAAAPPGDFEQREENALLAFSYSWPATVARIPALARHLRARMNGERAQAAINARAQQATARRGHYSFDPHSFDSAWQVEGRSQGLISLAAVTASFTGGGHAENGYAVLLWDLRAARPIQAWALFDAAAVRRLTPRFCAARLAARAAHLGEAPPANPEADDAWACPLLGEQLAAPADADGNGRFERLRMFVATGNFDVEGYTIDLPLSAADLAAIPAAYRASFESR
jgi:hypothetical protein